MTLFVVYLTVEDSGKLPLFNVDVDEAGSVFDFWSSSPASEHEELMSQLAELKETGGLALPWLQSLEEQFSVEMIPEALTSVGIMDIHPTLRDLALCAPEGAEVMFDGPSTIRVRSSNAIVFADILEGESRVEVLVCLTGRTALSAPRHEVEQWIDAQGIAFPARRIKAAHFDQQYGPEIRIEVPADAQNLSGFYEYVRHCADAWEVRGIVSPSLGQKFVPGKRGVRIAPEYRTPQNAWLLHGTDPMDGASERLETADLGKLGIYNTILEVPKNAQVGDLVLITSGPSRGDVNSIARIASEPYWDAAIDVGPSLDIANLRWGAYVTPRIQIQEIPRTELQQSSDSKRISEDQSDVFLSPDTIAAVKFRTPDGDHQACRAEELEVVAQVPDGIERLQGSNEPVSFETWKAIASGTLALDSAVSDYVVEPLLRLLTELTDPASVKTWRRDYPAASGQAGFVVMGHHINQPALVIDVRVAVRKANNTRWADSPDLRQLRRLMDDLHLPGILADSRALYLLAPGGDEPFRTVTRREATIDDLQAILELWRVGTAITGPSAA